MGFAEIVKSKVTWSIIFALIIGMALGNLLVDPTDALYYYWLNNGYLSNPWVATFVWYMLDGVFWGIIFVISYLIYYFEFASARSIIWLLLTIVILGLISTVIVESDVFGVYWIIFDGLLSAFAIFSIAYVFGYRIHLNW